jgi:hypothetical protein
MVVMVVTGAWSGTCSLSAAWHATSLPAMPS